MLSYIRPSTHRRTSANTRFAGFRIVGRPTSPTTFALGNAAWSRTPRFIPCACKASNSLLFPRLLRLMIRFLRHQPGHLLPIAPTSRPVVQLLIRNLHTQLLRTPRHRFPCRLKTALPILLLPPSALAPASRPLGAWPHSLTCASLPPPCPQPHIPSPTATPTTSFTRFHRSPRRNIPNACHLLAI
jgi:hypothetical protein